MIKLHKMCREEETIPSLDVDLLHKWWKDVFEKDSTAQLFSNAAWNDGLSGALMDHAIIQSHEGMHLFSKTIKPHMAADDQHTTGRCWAFAGLNLLRRNLAKRQGLKTNFSLSGAFIGFYDKLEKAYSFLRNVAYTRNLEDEDRTVQYILEHPITDGGNWHTFVCLVTKYGVVPSSCMTNSKPSNNTYILNSMLIILLKQSAYRIRHTHKNSNKEVEAEIRNVMKRVYRLLCLSIGVPPSSINWTYEDKDEDGVYSRRITPNVLFDECNSGISIENFILLTSLPDREIGSTFHVEYMDSVHGGVENMFLNVNDMRKAAKLAIHEKGVCVWFASEFGEMRVREVGVLHHKLIQHKHAIGENQEQDKKIRIQSRNVNIDHAMILTGFHEEEDCSVSRWQVENSHGDGDMGGYLTMTDGWFTRHIFTVAVPPDCVDATLTKKIGTSSSIQVKPWDILGNVLSNFPDTMVS